ncbi:hypothetical protein O7634_29875 [Micromonospora sp. WMMD1120]|uniref:hypothetical protein n=1 Tax=Micromonospora sp. WMMD1120 TaxID=3016106 RepID=UPI0024175557|nr:hypothetical protein [Micromonospora sp. WMMD1120]MDG4810988.1 hypothetical protein [Micromonospora sp. WMMD1120]
MLRYDEADLVAYVADHCSQVALALYDTTDQTAGVAALRRAVRRVGRIPHPDVPEDPLPSWCSVLVEDDVPVFRLDLKDEGQYAEHVVRIVLGELDAADIDGRLEPRRPPQPPYDYDAQADIFYGAATGLTELDAGLPPRFPAGFPAPREATLVLAQRARDGTWEHAAWRRPGRPFVEYPQQLRTFGCALGSVAAAEVAEYVDATCMVRYSLGRGRDSGSVSLYHEMRRPGQAPSNWYVSVVWRTATDTPPPLPKETPAPTSAADLDPAGVRERAPGFAGLDHTVGCETLLAISAASLAVNAAAAALPPRCHHERNFLRWQHRQLAPLLRGLSPDQMAVVRHACLTTISNWTYHRMARLPRLSLAHDDAGHLYAVDVRHAAAPTLQPEQILETETLHALQTAAIMLDPLLQSLRTAMADPRLTWAGTHQVTTAMRQRAGQLARTLEGITPEQLTDARDACWQIASNRPTPPAAR